MVKRIQLKRTFFTKGNKGRTVRLREFVEILDAGVMGNTNAEIEGLRSFKDEFGRAVNSLGGGRYQRLGFDEVLTEEV